MSKRKKTTLLVLACLVAFAIIGGIVYNEHLKSSLPDITIFDIGTNYADSSERVCLTGDMGYGNDAQRAVAAAMQEQGCTDIRFLGDIIYPSGITSADDPLFESNFLVPYQSLLQSASRVALVLGNHDYKGSVEPWYEVTKKHGLFFPSRYYVERSSDDICIVSIDTTLYDKVYFLLDAHKETLWLRKAKEALGQDCKFALMLSHHHFRSVGSHGDSSNPHMQYLLNSEVIGQFDLFISGHVHLLEDAGSEQDTHFLVSGAGGSNTGIRTESDTSLYASNNLGFVMVDFTSASNGNIAAHYAFYELTKPTKDNPDATVIGITRSGTVNGVGLR